MFISPRERVSRRARRQKTYENCFSKSKEFCSYGINKLFTIQDVVCPAVYVLCKALVNQASSVTVAGALGAKFFFAFAFDQGVKVIF